MQEPVFEQDDPEAQRKQFVRNTFNMVCEQYGKDNLRFFQNAAALLPELLALSGDEEVLDVATGTGLAAAQLAARLPRGRVTGIDLSEGMLEQAARRMAEEGHANVELLQMDMTRMELPDNHFDVINTSFGVFFVEDMNGLVRHIASKLKPGGRFITTHFARGSMEPMQPLIMDRLRQYGVEVPQAAWSQLDNEQANRELYEQAGFGNIRHVRNQVGYYFKDANDWWDVVWWAGFRGHVNQVAESQFEQFKREHLDEVSALGDDQGIFFNVEVIHTLGERV